MIDSDNVLLLEPAAPGRGFPGLPARTSGTSAASTDSGVVVATLYYTKPDSLEAFSALFDQSIRNRFESTGARTIAEYVTSTQPNSFPRLPIRMGEDIFVWLARFGSTEGYDAYRARLAADQNWARQIWPAIRGQLLREPEVLRLAPTNRSRLGGWAVQDLERRDGSAGS
jgi:hypothetical protein